MITLGFDVLPYDSCGFQMRLHVIGCTCDLPARAMVQNFTQYNGAYGCGFCEQMGTTTRTAAGGNIHTFPYLNKLVERTPDNTVKYAKQAMELNQPVCQLISSTACSFN